MRTQKIWNEHIFNELSLNKGVKHALFKSTLHVLDHITPSDEYNKIFRYILFKANKIDYGIPHLIPSTLIDTFPVQKNKKFKTIYDIFMKNNINYIIKEPHISLSELLIIKEIPKLLNKNDFIFIKFNALDRIGHIYGPLSKIIQTKIRYYDKLLQQIIKKINNKTKIIIMSDHGMVPVQYKFDLLKYLLRNGFIYGKHYISFLGATYASFWFKNLKYKVKIIDLLNKIKIGYFLDVEDKKNLGIEWIDKNYGEEIYAIKSKNLIFPEFYHIRKPPRGMHGYAFSNYDYPIFMIKNDDYNIEDKHKINFVDIMPTILELLKIPIPSYVEGKPII